MNTSSMEQRVLERLARWGRLPLSDIEAMLTPLERLEISNGFLDHLEQRGVVSSTCVGDERVYQLAAREDE